MFRKPVDAISLLRRDHARLRRVASDLRLAQDAATRHRLFDTLISSFRIHARAEEEVFYAAFRDAIIQPADRRLMREVLQERRLVEDLLEAFEVGDVMSPAYATKARFLEDLVEHHAGEEEAELFPRARRILSKDTLRELAARLEERKRQLTPTATRVA